MERYEEREQRDAPTLESRALLLAHHEIPGSKFDKAVIEGDKVDGVAIIEFASVEIAKAWYDSPAYRAIRHHREAGARYIGLLVEGGALPPELRMPHTKDRGSTKKP